MFAVGLSGILVFSWIPPYTAVWYWKILHAEISKYTVNSEHATEGCIIYTRNEIYNPEGVARGNMIIVEFECIDNTARGVWHVLNVRKP